MAADFFRADGVHAEAFDVKKTELSREDEARKQREKHVLVRKREFETKLNTFFEALAKNAPQEKAIALTTHIEEKLSAACAIADSQLAAKEVLNLERQAQASIRDLENLYRVARPRIGLSKAMLRDWSIYNTQFTSLQEKVFRPARELVEDLIGEEARKAELSLDLRVRTEATLVDLGQEIRRTVAESSRAVRKEADKVASEARDAAGQSLKFVESGLREVLSEFQRIDLGAMPDDSFIETRDALETKILKVAEEQRTFLIHSILEQLRAVDVTGESSTPEQLTAIEQRNFRLEEEVEANIQLVQLGMAIEIINHEFSGNCPLHSKCLAETEGLG